MSKIKERVSNLEATMLIKVDIMNMMTYESFKNNLENIRGGAFEGYKQLTYPKINSSRKGQGE